MCSVEGCDRPVACRGWCNRHYIRWQRRGSVEDRPDALTRYWSKVNQSDADGCWPWTGPLDEDGYGSFWFEGASVRSTRWGYASLVGPIPDGMFVCHTCDTPSCHQPEHWFLGTPGDNMADKVTKGRQARAESHGMARLDWPTVNAIRADHDLSSRALAVKYGVSPSQVLRILRNQSWIV